MNNFTKAILAAFLGNTIFGLSFLFSSVALEHAQPFVLLSIRFLTAFLVLNLVIRLGKIPFSLKGKPVKKLVLLGLLQPVLYFIFESYGIAMTSSSFSGIMLGLAPVAGLVLEVVFLHERCTLFQAVCTVLSVVGVALTTTGGMGTVSLPGFLLLVGAVITASLFAIVSRDIAPYFTAFERTYIMFLLGGTCFTAAALIQTGGDLRAMLAPLAHPSFWGALLYLAVISSVCAFTLLNFSLNYLSAGQALIFTNFVPVISLLAGIFIMGDTFTPVQLGGILIILLSVFGVSWQSSRASKT